MTGRLRQRLAQQPPGYRFTIGRILAIYAGIMVALLLAALDQTIVATALPRIVSDLGGLSSYSWVFTAYMLATTVTVPVYGKLGDLYGRRPLFLLAISLFLLAYPAYLGLKAYRLPWIYDVTTDPIDAPRYEWLARIRPADANPAAYAGLYAAEQQRRAYPDIGPLSTSATPEAAYRAALTVMNKHKDSFLAPYWRVVDAREPAGRRDGRIEAVARSTLMGFRDDVVVRVREDPDGARIDARSSSRYGSFDFGTNASRIRRLLNDIEDMIRTQRNERPAARPAPTKKPAGKKDQSKRERDRR